MSPTKKLNNIRAWCELHASDKVHWWRPWHKGYIQACKDILLLSKSEVSVMPLNEYKALEGYYEEVYGRKDS